MKLLYLTTQFFLKSFHNPIPIPKCCDVMIVIVCPQLDMKIKNTKSRRFNSIIFIHINFSEMNYRMLAQ